MGIEISGTSFSQNQPIQINEDKEKLLAKLRSLKDQLELLPLTADDRKKISDAVDAKMSEATTVEEENQTVDEFSKYIEDNLEELQRKNSIDIAATLLISLYGTKISEDDPRATTSPSPLSVASGNITRSFASNISTDEVKKEEIQKVALLNEGLRASIAEDDALIAQIMRRIFPEEGLKVGSSTEGVRGQLRGVLGSKVPQKEKEEQIKGLIREAMLESFSPGERESVAEGLAKVIVAINDPKLSKAEKEEIINQKVEQMLDRLYPTIVPFVPTPLKKIPVRLENFTQLTAEQQAQIINRENAIRGKNKGINADNKLNKEKYVHDAELNTNRREAVRSTSLAIINLL